MSSIHHHYKHEEEMSPIKSSLVPSSVTCRPHTDPLYLTHISTKLAIVEPWSCLGRKIKIRAIFQELLHHKQTNFMQNC